MRLIIGLGNPDKRYARTRHNLGFMVLEQLAREQGWRFRSGSCYQGLVAEGSYQKQPLALLLPLTYMNHSGVAVKDLVVRKEIALADILVVCDDFNLELGQLRVRAKGSDGGHNGLTSVITQLQSEDFARLRVGIGQPPKGADTANFVLEDFSAKEKKQLPDIVQEAVACCLLWLNEDMSQVMAQFNKRTSNE